MPELFDFITGSGTGAIIAGTLVVPSGNEGQINKNFADVSTQFF
jgi:hypothetical protein